MFRRLVQLQIFLFLVSLLIFIGELMSEPFASFDSDFEALVTKYFGPGGLNEPTMVQAAVLITIFGWMLSSIAGLLWFKRWARFGSWASLLAAAPVLWWVDGDRPSYTSLLTDWLSFVDAGLFGAVLLLAYAQDYGATWFASERIDKDLTDAPAF